MKKFTFSFYKGNGNLPERDNEMNWRNFFKIIWDRIELARPIIFQRKNGDLLGVKIGSANKRFLPMGTIILMEDDIPQEVQDYLSWEHSVKNALLAAGILPSVVYAIAYNDLYFDGYGILEAKDKILKGINEHL